MKSYITVSVYRNANGDCSLGGVTSKDDTTLVVEVKDGNISEIYLEEYGYTVLEVKPSPIGSNHIAFKPANEKRRGMFGGNFVWSSDSRFRELYPNPVPVHDRFEG